MNFTLFNDNLFGLQMSTQVFKCNHPYTKSIKLNENHPNQQNKHAQIVFESVPLSLIKINMNKQIKNDFMKKIKTDGIFLKSLDIKKSRKTKLCKPFIV